MAEEVAKNGYVRVQYVRINKITALKVRSNLEADCEKYYCTSPVPNAKLKAAAKTSKR